MVIGIEVVLCAALAVFGFVLYRNEWVYRHRMGLINKWVGSDLWLSVPFDDFAGEYDEWMWHPFVWDVRHLVKRPDLYDEIFGVD